MDTNTVLPRDGIKLALLDFATQYSMLACGMCLEWAPRLFRYGVTKPGPGCCPRLSGTK